jgi:hypothetical protein
MYYPLKPSEIFLKKTANIFPSRELAEWRAQVETDINLKVLERRGTIDAKLEWKEDMDLEAVPFPAKEEREGCVQIWELPEDNPPDGLYIASTDPYDQDDSTTSSLGSTLIYKRYAPGNGIYDTLVAEYTARPDKSEDYYLDCTRLLRMYNAVDLYENQLRGFYTYIKNKGLLHLLAEQPEILKDIIKDSKVSRGYGIHMTSGIRRDLEIRAKDWMLTEYEPGKLNLTKIYSLSLLDELIAYDGEGNFDRVDAFLILMAYLAELELRPVVANTDIIEYDNFFEKEYFKVA